MAVNLGFLDAEPPLFHSVILTRLSGARSKPARLQLPGEIGLGILILHVAKLAVQVAHVPRPLVQVLHHVSRTAVYVPYKHQALPPATD
jgi:hypothetical protein